MYIFVQLYIYYIHTYTYICIYYMFEMSGYNITSLIARLFNCTRQVPSVSAAHENTSILHAGQSTVRRIP